MKSVIFKPWLVLVLIFLAGVGTGILLTVGLGAHFMHPPGVQIMKRHWMSFLTEKLNLTADQQGKLLALHKEKNAEAKPLFDQMKAIRDKVKAELLKSEPSKQALDNFASQLGDLHRQLVRNMNEHLLKVKAILTPDQFSKLVNFDWMGSGPGMHPGMHHGMGGHGSDKDSE